MNRQYLSLHQQCGIRQRMPLNRARHHTYSRILGQFSGPAVNRGLTLIELLVAMAIGLLIVLVATTVLVFSQRGAVVVDGAAQLRDDARFATELIQRLAVQAGFEDLDAASMSYKDTPAHYKLANNNTDIATLQPNIFGFNNALPSPTDPLNSARTRSGSDKGNGSDVLILQYQTVKADLSKGAGAPSDGSIINCNGLAPDKSSIRRDDRIASVLYVDNSQGDLALMCITQGSTGWSDPEPILKGVENFQVLYGVDNVEPGKAISPLPSKVAAGSATEASPKPADSVPDRYLRADQLTVSGNTAATYANWRRVRSLRIGMVLRGPAGSAHENLGGTFYPLGNKEYPYDSSNDPGSEMEISSQSGGDLVSRLRQTVTFTVQLRNCQNQGYQPTNSEQPCDVVLPE